jgi:hypothetical protein|tara:strand:+ start:1052 stop:1324 length:273 start_codon:yes stop_codon:yes gene_type:complete
MYEGLKDKIAGATNETLHEWMANAIATTRCIGHCKGDMNERYAKFYHDALLERGEDVPEINFWKCLKMPNGTSYRDKLHKIGKFNGPGSY